MEPPRPTIISVGGGIVTVLVLVPGGAFASGYHGTLTLVLTDQNTCGVNVNCSAVGVVTVNLASGICPNGGLGC